MNRLEIKTKEVLKKFNIHPNKKLGQNFLIKQEVLDSIVNAAQISKDDLIIEIGPGLGILTEELCRRAGRVIAVELDKRFIDILGYTLNKYNNYTIVNKDILGLDIRALLKEFKHEGNIKVVANLPYYITTPIIMKLLEAEAGFKSIVVMLQKEVAHRITAFPGGKIYGALTIAVGYYGSPEIISDVPPVSFIPIPEVESSVLKIEIYDKPKIDVKDKDMFFKIVKAAFSQRRKTIINGLTNSGLFEFDKSELNELLESVGIEGTQRPETLSIEEFAKITNKLKEPSLLA